MSRYYDMGCFCGVGGCGCSDLGGWMDDAVDGAKSLLDKGVDAGIEAAKKYVESGVPSSVPPSAGGLAPSVAQVQFMPGVSIDPALQVNFDPNQLQQNWGGGSAQAFIDPTALKAGVVAAQTAAAASGSSSSSSSSSSGLAQAAPLLAVGALVAIKLLG